MNEKSIKAPLAMTPSMGKKKFLCRIVEGSNRNAVVKIPSTFAAIFEILNLDIIGLHLPMKKTWLGRYVSSSQTVVGLETMMEYFGVNPCYMFAFEYIGGTEFEVEIFNEYAVEVDYLATMKCGIKCSRLANSTSMSRNGGFDLSEIDRERLISTFTYNASSTFDGDCEVVINEKHLAGTNWTEFMPKEAAMELGMHPTDDWIDIAFTNLAWRVRLQWDSDALLFDKEWIQFATSCQLQIGDICILRNTTTAQRFEVVVIGKERSKDFYKNGSVEGKSMLKFFKILNWMSVHTGEVDVPYVFAKKYGPSISEDAKIYLPDGMVYSCYFSKTGKLVYGIKDLLGKYGVQENWTLVFDYVGNSIFYASIYNENGMDIFNDFMEKLSLHTVLMEMAEEVIVLTDTDDEEDVQPAEGGSEYNFSIQLLRSHVDQNNHGVFLPRHLYDLYKNWKKGTMVKLIMDSTTFNLAILRRKKTCRLGVGWNEFTLKNKLHVHQILNFSYRGNATFEVSVHG